MLQDLHRDGTSISIESSYEIRACTSRQELASCVRLQKEIWRYPDAELYPLRLFVNLGQVGGHVIGAFAKRVMVGFVASLPAWRNRTRYFHSLSLGVVPAHQNRGVGRMLKLAQRERALKEGIRRIEWTFDPLRAGNAFFNIVRLGAICRRYIADYYGEVDSRFQRGLPSDRLVAEWWLNSRRVLGIVAGREAAQPTRAIVQIEIPADVERLKKKHLADVRKLQTKVREQFRNGFAQGLAVTGFEIKGESACYLLACTGTR